MMNPVTINQHPATTGPILDPGLQNAPTKAVITAVVAAAIEVAEQGVKECYAGARQIDPIAYRLIGARYPDGEAWRCCATPALTHLVDALRAITSDIPEARRDSACHFDGAIVPAQRTNELTDEVQLNPRHVTDGDPS